MTEFKNFNGNAGESTKYHPLYYVDSGEYSKFEFDDGDVYLDVNTLDLFSCPEDRVPAPIPVVPQHRPPSNRTLRALSLNVTHACQLRCDYCYLSHFYPEMIRKMDFPTAKKAVDTLFDWDIIGKLPDDLAGSKKFKLGFFGGEPVLNFDVVKEVVAYIEGKTSHFKFSMTTNGFGITPSIAQFLKEHNFSLVFSLDGTQEDHDHHRKTAGKRGSFTNVMAGLHHLKAAGVRRITLRGTFLPDRVGLLARVKYLNQLCDDGFATGVSIEPACLSESCGYAPEAFQFTRKGVEGLWKEYEAVSNWLVERINAGKPARFHNIMVYVDRLVKKKAYSTQCYAGVGYMAASPDGKVFACHREMSSRIGNLKAGGVDERDRAKWLDNRHYCIEQCMKCPIRNVCGGPCREHNLTMGNDIHTNDIVSCGFYNNWVKAAVNVVSTADPERLQKLYAEAPVVAPSKKKWYFVREGGGFGDIISMGGAAVQLKLKEPDANVTLCIPNDFMEVAQHLEGVDNVIGLGLVKDLATMRRNRTDSFDRKHSYLFGVPEDGEVIDMWCPGYEYEVTALGPLDRTRSQIFADCAGCEDTNGAVAIWNVTPEEHKKASAYLTNFNDGPKGVVALAPRGTDSNRSISPELVAELAKWLTAAGFGIVYLDCIAPPLGLPVHACPSNFCQSVAIVSKCDALITVDTSFLHIGPAVYTPTLGVFTLNDAGPYLGFYSPLVVVTNEEEIEECSLPCNRSKAKGYTDVCRDNCKRKQLLSMDKLSIGVAHLLQMAMDPHIREKRLERMKA